MREESRAFLEKYLNTASPTGFEAEGQKVWLDYIRPYIHTHIVDTYGTVVGVVNPEAKYKVVIEAHSDEISWFVHYITDSGYIYVRQNGGSDPQIAPSKRVNIHTPSGIVKGYFGWPAIHTRRFKEKPENPELKNIYIDIGCDSKEEVLKAGVTVGSVVTFEDELMYVNDRYFVGRALDNRIGGFMIAEVLRRLHEEKVELPFGLYVVNAVQEEVGLRGAEMIARRLRPDVAIITDVCHDTQAPLYDKVASGDFSCGKGPVLTFAPAVQRNLLQLLIDTAEKNEIPYQRAAASRATGTDTDAFAYSGEGTASALISLPLKYMHTTNEAVHKDDIENVILLMKKTLLEIKDGHDFRYFS